MNSNQVTVELCGQCHRSTSLNTYYPPYENNSVRAFYLPSRSDVFAIADSLNRPCVEQEILAKEIQELKRLLNILDGRHSHLNSHITRSRQFITTSPIRRLPTEILSIVFMFACNSSKHDYFFTPVYLRDVCSKWRGIVLDTPSLWTHIFVSPRLFMRDMFDYYIDRCGALLFSITIESYGLIHPLPSQDYARLLLHVFKTMRSWRHAEIPVIEDPMLLHMPIARGPIPLESLQVRVKGRLDLPPVYVPDICLNAPKLRSFAVVGCDGVLHNHVWPAAVPWAQIEDVVTEVPHLTEVSKIPSKFLDGEGRRLVIRPSEGKYATGIWVRPPSFSGSITSLVLEPKTWSAEMSRFLGDIIVPNLHHLFLVYPDWETQVDGVGQIYEDGNALRAVKRLVSNSGCALRTFSFTIPGKCNSLYSDDTLELSMCLHMILAQSTELVTLRIHEGQADGPILLGDKLFDLCANETGGNLKTLKNVELVWQEDRQPPDSLTMLLDLRAALSTVTLGIRNGGRMRPEVVEHMRLMRESGVQVALW